MGEDPNTAGRWFSELFWALELIQSCLRLLADAAEARLLPGAVLMQDLMSNAIPSTTEFSFVRRVAFPTHWCVQEVV